MLIVLEGLKTYQTAGGGSETAMAYTRADLTEEDKEALRRMRETCARYAKQLESAMEALQKPTAAPRPPQNLRVVR